MKRWIVIPARAGSKRIPGKNLRDFCGKPLVQWTIELATLFNATATILTSDDGRILDLGRKFNIETVERTQAMASDHVHASIAVRHALDAQGGRVSDEDEIVVLLPTCPLRLAQDIYEACRIFGDLPLKAASVVGAYEGPTLNRIRSITETGELGGLEHQRFSPLAQTGPKTFVVNGAVFVTTKKCLGYGFRASPCFPYIMPKERSIDIDTEEDWKMAEVMFKIMNLSLEYK